jgi:hypothetical protein
MKNSVAVAMMLGAACVTLSAQKIVGAHTREEKKNLAVAVTEFKDML